MGHERVPVDKLMPATGTNEQTRPREGPVAINTGAANAIDRLFGLGSRYCSKAAQLSAAIRTPKIMPSAADLFSTNRSSRYIVFYF